MIKLAAKLILLVATIWLIGIILEIFYIGPFWGNSLQYNKYVFGKPMIERANTLFIGSSTMKHGINASHFDQQIGEGYSYNFSEGFSIYPESFYTAAHFISNATDYPELKHVYLELSKWKEPQEHLSNTLRMKYFQDWHHFEKIRSSVNPSNPKEWSGFIKHVKMLLLSTFNINMLNEFAIHKFKNPKDFKTYNEEMIGYKNYYNRKKVIQWQRTAKYRKAQSENYVNQLKEIITDYDQVKTAGDEVIIDHLNHLKNSARNNGISITLVMMPRLDVEDYKNLVPLFNAYQGAKLNLANPIDNYEFYDVCDFAFDRYHLNLVGASILSEKLAEYHMAQY